MTDIDTDDLYAFPLERFVPERDALARAIRAEGRREEAAVVARLPKPSVTAWVVNQLVRGNREAVKSLLDAGDALGAAQTAVIEGRGDAHSLRAAAERERAAVDELVGAARSLAGAGGPALSNTIIDRVADTLHAAALDEAARERVRDGRLARELRHVGLGGLAAGPLAPEKPQPAAKRDPANVAKPDAAAAAKAPEQADAEARKAAKQAEAEARATAKQAEADARAALRAAKQAEAHARRRAERAARALTRAEERQEQAAQALREADDVLGAAHTESEAAGEAFAVARSEAESAAEAHRQAASR